MSKPHFKTLIHTALLAEARPIIQRLKLTQNTFMPKIYENSDTILVVSGMGEKNTQDALKSIFSSYLIDQAFNIGIAGCTNEQIPLGSMFSTVSSFENIQQASITSVHEPVNDKTTLQTLLVDMESEAFLQECFLHLPQKKCHVLKVVSDHCSTAIPKKSFVIELIQKNIQQISALL